MLQIHFTMLLCQTNFLEQVEVHNKSIPLLATGILLFLLSAKSKRDAILAWWPLIIVPTKGHFGTIATVHHTHLLSGHFGTCLGDNHVQN